MNKFSHQEINWCMNIASIRSSASKTFKTKDDSQELEISADFHKPKEWAQNFSNKKPSVRKHHALGGGTGSGHGGNHKCQCANQKQMGKELNALAASFSSLSRP